MKVLRKNVVFILLILILMLAVFFRFYNFNNRWGFAYDQVRDVLVARHALRIHDIPLIGPFASAGPFVYGPEWYWILIGMIIPARNFLILPWIIQNLLYCCLVLLAYLTGKEIENKYLGIILSLFTAVSTAQVSQAINLTSPSMTGVFAFLSTYFFILFIKYGKKRDAFLLGVFIACAITIHFQSMGLLVLLPVSFLFRVISLKEKKKSHIPVVTITFTKKEILLYSLMLVGFILPFLPLAIFDIKTNFFESRNMLQYYLHDQYKISLDVLGRRWITYLAIFLPTAWARIIGGYRIVGYFLELSVLGFLIFALHTKRANKYILATSFSLFLIILLLRYYHGPLFDSYLTFTHPFILALSAWTCYQFFKYNKQIGISLCVVIALTSISVTTKEMMHATNQTAQFASHYEEVLEGRFPQKKFAIYDYKYKTSDKSLPLSLYLDINNKIDDHGVKVGLLVVAPQEKLTESVIYGQKGSYQLVNLEEYSSKQLTKQGWILVNPSQVYKSIVKWYEKR